MGFDAEAKDGCVRGRSSCGWGGRNSFAADGNLELRVSARSFCAGGGKKDCLSGFSGFCSGRFLRSFAKWLCCIEFGSALAVGVPHGRAKPPDIARRRNAGRLKTRGERRRGRCKIG